jgi:serine/threonine-protein kinase RsbW
MESPRTAVFLAHFESLDSIREFVGKAAEDYGFKEKDVYAVQMAVDEACSNIIEHAYGGECQDEIECACSFEAQAITVQIIDCGERFNPLEIPEPDLNARLEDRDAGGLGLFFMRKLMDEVSFSFNQDVNNDEIGCNILTMVKRQPRNPS